MPSSTQNMLYGLTQIKNPKMVTSFSDVYLHHVGISSSLAVKTISPPASIIFKSKKVNRFRLSQKIPSFSCTTKMNKFWVLICLLKTNQYNKSFKNRWQGFVESGESFCFFGVVKTLMNIQRSSEQKKRLENTAFIYKDNKTSDAE